MPSEHYEKQLPKYNCLQKRIKTTVLCTHKPKKTCLFFDGLLQCPVSLILQMQSVQGPEEGGNDGANSILLFADICSPENISFHHTLS